MEVLVDLSPGSGQVWTLQAMSKEARDAASLAAVLALGGARERWSVGWQVRAEDHSEIYLSGRSLGLALTVAMRAAATRRRIPPSWAFSGEVDLHGHVGGVGSLPDKLRAAESAGCTHVAIPAVSAGGLAVSRGVTLVPVLTVEPLLQRLFPPPRRRWTWVVAAAVVAGMLCGGAATWMLPRPTPDVLPEVSAERAPGGLFVCFDSSGTRVPPTYVFSQGERFGVWVTVPENGAVVVFQRDAGGLVQPLYPRPDAAGRVDPKPISGGVPTLIPEEAYGAGWPVQGDPGTWELIVLWTKGALAGPSVLHALVESPPTTASGWARAFPDVDLPGMPAPLEGEQDGPCTRLVWTGQQALVGRIPVSVGASQKDP